VDAHPVVRAVVVRDCGVAGVPDVNAVVVAR